jgi:capsular exopolysaccharide synthesis family protein
LSRNFEILQRASEQQYSHSSLIDAAALEPPRPDLNPQALSRSELVKLVQRVFLLPNSGGRKVVTFTGVQEGTGCSSICAGAAEALAAQTDGTVCLVDANLHRPGLHLYFNFQNLKGLSDAVFSQSPLQDFVCRLPGGKLMLLPAGSKVTRLNGALNSEQLRTRFAQLREQFDFVLIDAPAMNGSADAVLISKLADGAILVLESDATRREVARTAKENFESAGVRLLGAVLNKRTFPIPRFIYERL